MATWVRRTLAFYALAVVCCVTTISGRAADPVAAPPPLKYREGDPIWRPTEERLARWVSDGMTAAAMEMYLPDVAGIATWSWIPEGDGLALPGGRMLQFAAAMTPEVVATVTGWAAAWDDDTWARIQKDQNAVARELAAKLHPQFGGGLDFVVAVDGPRTTELVAAVYFAGGWRHLDPDSGRGLATFADDTVEAAHPTTNWAAMYLLSQCLDFPALNPPDGVNVHVCRLSDINQTAPAELLPLLPTPQGYGSDQWRLAIGGQEGLAYCDLNCPFSEPVSPPALGFQGAPKTKVVIAIEEMVRGSEFAASVARVWQPDEKVPTVNVALQPGMTPSELRKALKAMITEGQRVLESGELILIASVNGKDVMQGQYKRVSKTVLLTPIR